MVNFNDWLANQGQSPMSDSRYAMRQWRLIQRKPTSITILRGTTLQSAQTVRVEYSNAERPVTGESGAVSYKRDVIVFGVKNHPDEDVADTDIKKSDVFEYEGQDFMVLDVIQKIGSIEARCEVYS